MTTTLTLQTLAMAVAESLRPADSPSGAPLEERFMQIVSNHGGLIARLCFYYAGSTADFDDLRQDCLINIWRGLPRFDNRSSLTTWIYRVCLNTCVSAVRKASRRPEEVPLQLAREVAGDDDSERVEQLEQLYSLISRLPFIDRGIVMMWLDGCTYDEIADVNGISRNNVAVRLHRIKALLSKEFKN